MFSLKTAGFLTLLPVTTQRCRELLPLALLNSLYVGLALAALSVLSVPTYSLLKRLSIVLVLVFEQLFLGKPSSLHVKLAAGVIVVGILVAGAGDLSFNAFGYVLTIAACVAQVMYLIVVKKKGVAGDDSHDLLFYNSLLGLPLVLAMALLMGEFGRVAEYEHLSDAGFLVSFFINISLGTLLVYSTFLCTNVTSPLTWAVAGQMKGTTTIIIGLFTFGGVKVSPLNGTGIVINTLGSFLYSYVKYQERFKPTKSMSQSAEEHGAKCC
eukprot:TRINITY_DN14397_c0_g1_i1.p1 TRINITY_DN14397_c0_g1~~TRINITY_DN14397_c0_g1_i1.p1  ORF type:complete len:287 (-),score=115.50 TRINITY_DN14397_c0_g1_i1:179-982(-)